VKAVTSKPLLRNIAAKVSEITSSSSTTKMRGLCAVDIGDIRGRNELIIPKSRSRCMPQRSDEWQFVPVDRENSRHLRPDDRA
jgi:hypothetical protein